MIDECALSRNRLLQIMRNITVVVPQSDKSSDQKTTPVKRIPKKPSELSRFLFASRHSIHDQAWLGRCRKSVLSSIQSAYENKVSNVHEVLDRTIRAYFNVGGHLLPRIETRLKKPTQSRVKQEQFALDIIYRSVQYRLNLILLKAFKLSKTYF